MMTHEAQKDAKNTNADEPGDIGRANAHGWWSSSSSDKPPRKRSSRRLAIWLLLAFALTIASFITATALSEYRARGIESAAQSITKVAIPAIDHLARARTELRHIEVLLDDFAEGNGFSGMALLEQSRKTYEREYADYLKLAPYQGERVLWTRVTASTTEMNAAIDSVLARVARGDDAGAIKELNLRAKPAIDALDIQLLEASELNGDQAAELSSRIASIRNAARAWGILLDTLSLVLAAIAAMLVIRVVSRFADLMEARTSDLEHFAGRVAHDIRSPLQSVSLVLDLTKQQNPTLDPKAASMLDRGLRTLQRVGQLVDGLLVFAKAGRSPPHKSYANVKEIIIDVTDEMRHAADAKGIALNVDEVPASWAVACSPGVLVSLVSNVVGNAIKYIDSSSGSGSTTPKRIDVRVRAVGVGEQTLRVEVRDTGPGVPFEQRERIFDPYTRGAADSSSIPGIGLGLATVRRLVDAHGGSVGVDANVDRGSLFWFELPRATRKATRVNADSGARGAVFRAHEEGAPNR